MFEINNTVIDVEGRTLLNIRHLAVQKPKTVALIRRNGSGKTTLFKYIIENQHAVAGSSTVHMVPQIKEKSDREKRRRDDKSVSSGCSLP